ncbi:TPA: hypothetical protein U5E01_003783 [Yersinia enterocolitica]|nr:hypothetical protein [Yersinia enterocolitica]
MTMKKYAIDTDTIRLNDEIKKSLIFMAIFSILGAALIPLNAYYHFSFPWLYVSPAYFKEPDLSWITSVWSSILGIHGTLAALSITFLGMLVGQASVSSDKHFAPFCRLIILRKNDFLRFSTEAICGLITGIILLTIGGGVIQYVFSVSISIYFIFSYIKIYFELYKYTERPERVAELLLSELKSAGGYVNERNKFINSLKSDFEKKIKDLVYLSLDFESRPVTKKEVYFNIENNDNLESPMGFYPEKLKLLDEKIQRLPKDLKVELCILVPFSNSNQPIHVKMVHDEKSSITPELIEEIKKYLQEAIKYSKPDMRFLNYKELEECLIKSICENLKDGDVEGVSFGVSAIVLLAPDNNLTDLLNKVSVMLLSRYKSDDLTIFILCWFYKRLYELIFPSTNKSNFLLIYKSLIEFPFYLYDKNKYQEYLIQLKGLIHSNVLYGEYRDECLNIYISSGISNFINQYYELFEMNTELLTMELDFYDVRMKPILSKSECYLISAMREFVALILIRMKFLLLNNDIDTEELKILREFLLKWVNPKFLEGIFFMQETYSVLFEIPNRFSERASTRKLKNISENEIYSLDPSQDFGEAIITLLLMCSRKNNLDLTYIADFDFFYDKTKTKVSFIDEMLMSLAEPDFCLLMNYIESGLIESEVTDELQRNIETLKHTLEALKDTISKIINNKVADAVLNESLVEKYKSTISQKLNNDLSKIIDMDRVRFSSIKINNPYGSLIEKREVMDSINGVFYSQNTRNHALRALYDWIRDLFKKIDFDNINIVKINSIDDLNIGKFITIHNGELVSRTIHRYSRGISIYDKNGVYNLPGSGLYYLDICNEFDVVVDGNDMFDVVINLINKDNESELIEKYNFSLANILLMSEILISINVMATKKNGVTLRYLSNEKAEEIFNSEESARQELTKIKTADVNQQVVE